MTDLTNAPSKPDWPSRRLAFLALVFLLLGGLGLVGYNAAFPTQVTIMVSDLAHGADGLLVAEFSRPWPLKINKRALDQITVTLSDGRKLESLKTRAALFLDRPGPSFFVDHPKTLFRLDDAILADPDTALFVTLPTKTRDILYQLPLSLAAVLFLASWLGVGVCASLKAPRRRNLVVATGSLTVMLAGLLSLGIAEGAGVWLAFLAIFLGPMIAVTTLLQAEAAVTGRPSRSRESIIKLALLLGSVLGSFILIEAYLRWNSANLDEAAPSPTETKEEWFLLPERIVRLAASRTRHLTLPDAWSRRSTTVEGASLAYTWHGALHVYDKEGFRRINGPFPPKDPETFRIMVVGDSLTYGIGIATDWTYSNLLERSLKESYRTEVFNLGHSGYQSEDILGVLHRFMPRLDPDLVVYAVCLNDFLPSGQHVYDAAYAFPLPKEWKTYLLDRTHLARLFTDVYSALLLALDLKADFFEDILAGGKNYQERFARDVAAMNRLVKDKGVPSIVGIVFHQNPGGDQRGWELVEIAERGLEDAGFDLVSIKHWRERFKSRTFLVSRWEGHPNELANAALAEELHKHILERGYLQGYRTSN